MAKMRPTVRCTHAREAWLVPFKSDRGLSANPLFADLVDPHTCWRHVLCSAFQFAWRPGQTQ
jgi:hypothetical protein